MAKFDIQNYARAHSLVMTRAFGWNIPNMMLVPMADNCNHHCIENYFELVNSRLTTRALKGETSFNNFEKEYFTSQKKRLNILKHFYEDSEALDPEVKKEICQQEQRQHKSSLTYFKKVQSRTFT